MDNAEKLENIGYTRWKKRKQNIRECLIDAFSLNVILFIKHNQDGSSMLYSV